MSQINQINSCLFWDVDASSLDIVKHKRFIIERVLQYGMPKDICRLLQQYTKEDLRHVVEKSKTIDRRTANYWRIYLGISKEHILCLNRPLISEQFYS